MTKQKTLSVYFVVISLVIVLLIKYYFYFQFTRKYPKIATSRRLMKTLDSIESKRFTCADHFDWRRSGDILCMARPLYLKEYKNPCFVTKLNGKDHMSCLPYFQLIGVDKSATSDVFFRITKHPDVIPNAGIGGKETQWWSWKRYGMNLFFPPNSSAQPLPEYLQYFKPLVNALRKYDNRMQKKAYVTGDGTPMDFWDFRGWTKIPQNQGLQEPLYLTPHLIRHINPYTKFIILFRNPVQRLLSDYRFLSVGTQTPEAFHDNVLKAITVLQTCEIEQTRRQCLFNSSMFIQWDFTARIHLGFYSIYLNEWFKVFPRAQFRILRTEDYSSNMTYHLNKIFKFLEIGDLSQQKVRNIVGYGIAKKRKDRMLAKTKHILDQLYLPDMKNLAEMLGEQSFMWPDSR